MMQMNRTNIIAKKRTLRGTGFSLLELLVVVSIIAILAALLLPALSRAKAKATLAVCLSNSRQINLGVRLYAVDRDDFLPPIVTRTNAMAHPFTAYTVLIKEYVGMTATSAANAKLFACPADKFSYDFETTARIYLVH